MKYLNNYNTLEEANQGVNMTPNVTAINNLLVYTNGDEYLPIIFFEKDGKITSRIDSISLPLNFTAEENNSTVRLKMNWGKRLLDTSYEYSEDGVNWNTYTIGDTITLTNIGDKVYFRGDNSEVSFTESDYMQFEMSGSIAAGGNAMSILDSTMNSTSVPSYGMCSLFRYCASLTVAPKLPATTLATSCYESMFYGCTSLTTAPELPATTLATSCYESMFNRCSSLATAPELPATTLADNCYTHMFYECTSLTTAPELPATTLAVYCYMNIFYGCTSLTTAPELPATELKDHCYQQMFYRCSSLTELTVYADDISASDCLSNWLTNTASGTLHSLGTADFTGKIPGYWTISTTPVSEES